MRARSVLRYGLASMRMPGASRPWWMIAVSVIARHEGPDRLQLHARKRRGGRKHERRDGYGGKPEALIEAPGGRGEEEGPLSHAASLFFPSRESNPGSPDAFCPGGIARARVGWPYFNTNKKKYQQKDRLTAR